MLRQHSNGLLRHSARTRQAQSSWAHKIDEFVGTAEGARNVSQSNNSPLSVGEYQDALKDINAATMANVVPWFVATMSPSYFYTVPMEDQAQHLRTLVALYGIGAEPSITLGDTSAGSITIIQPGDGTGLSGGLNAALLSQIPPGAQLQGMKKFTAIDGSVTIIRVDFDEPLRFGQNRSGADDGARRRILSAAAEILNTKDSGMQAELLQPDVVEHYLTCCPSSYVHGHRRPRRLLEQLRMYNAVAGTDQAEVSMEEWKPSDFGVEVQDEWLDQKVNRLRWFLTFASGHANPNLQLASLADYLGSKGMSIRGVHLDMIHDDQQPEHPVMMLRLFLAVAETGAQDAPAELSETDVERICKDIRLLKWIDNNAIHLATTWKGKVSDLSFAHAEIIDAYASCVHGPLMKVNKYAFSLSGIKQLLDEPPIVKLASKIAGLFLRRFEPKGEGYACAIDSAGRADPLCTGAPLTDEQLAEQAADIRTKIFAVAGAGDAGAQLLDKMLDGVLATVKTNFFVPDRYGFGIRLKPEFMGVNEDISHEVPYGTFFVRGKRMVAFHVRWRDVARGGLRMSVPVSYGDHAIRAMSVYDEAYALSYAQQLKNKDIPEGGSKAVCVVDPYPYDGVYTDFLTRKSVKSFSDTILTMTSLDPKINAFIVNHDPETRPEQVYLGPDENIIPQDINWMTTRAARRSYPCPSAFISSKPDAGFNHKEYGVTSEGVNVFLAEALMQYGIDPYTEPFTVKISGGTDGDVAGNMIKFIARDYAHPKVVAICDGTATIEDPTGIPLEALLSLVEANQPLAAFDTSALSSKGGFWSVDTEEGVLRRNSMPMRVVADVFVPGGGRPATVNASNWRDYLTADGKSSTPLVVEGANLFFTPAARKALWEEAGTVFVKDSSANKCGVITSSYEILLSMMFNTQEFLELKKALVPDVLKKIRGLARAEVKLLYREGAARNDGTSLVEISAEISDKITVVHDALEQRLHAMSAEELSSKYGDFRDVLLDHLPAAAHPFADKLQQVPLAYRMATVAANLSSKMVYSEGCGFVSEIEASCGGDKKATAAAFAETALRYREQKARVTSLVEGLKTGGLGGLSEADAAEVAALLEAGGVRSGLQMRRGRQ